MSFLSLRNVSKQYDPRSHNFAVSDLSFDVEQGELVALLGPSGCGKSSTLRMIAGLEEVSAGQILVNGQVLNHVPPSRRNIGMAFETYSLYPPLTIYDNIAYNLKARHLPPNEIRMRVNRIARMLGIEELLESKPGRLSGGQKQRVNLARAIVREPALLLLDEPLSHLDTGERRRLRRELKRIHEDTHLTTVLVTHDQSEAMALADRIVVLHDGKLQQADRITDIYEYPQNLFVASFIGEPAMNFLDGLVEGETIHLETGDNWQIRGGRTRGPVVIGVRPDDLLCNDPHQYGSEASSNSTVAARLSGVVTSIEYLGDEVQIVITTNKPPNQKLIRVTDESEGNRSIGETVDLLARRFHVFSKETGQRLGTVESDPTEVASRFASMRP
jgi:multiple sugar transport system ATP-binding protein